MDYRDEKIKGHAAAYPFSLFNILNKILLLCSFPSNVPFQDCFNL